MDYKTMNYEKSEIIQQDNCGGVEVFCSVCSTVTMELPGPFNDFLLRVWLCQEAREVRLGFVHARLKPIFKLEGKISQF